MCGQRSSVATIPAGVWASRMSSSPRVTRRMAPSGRSATSRTASNAASAAPIAVSWAGNAAGRGSIRVESYLSGTNDGPGGVHRGRRVRGGAKVSRSGGPWSPLQTPHRVRWPGVLAARRRPVAGAAAGLLGPECVLGHERGCDRGDGRRDDADPERLGDRQAECRLDAQHDLGDERRDHAPGPPPGQRQGSPLRGHRPRSGC